MKQRLPLLISILLWSIVSSAQITITQSAYPASVVGADSLMVTTYNSAYPSLPAATAAFWDLNMVTDSAAVFFAYHVSATGYTFADSEHYTLLGFAYQGNITDSIASEGLFQYDININGTAYTLIGITSSLTDSLFIDSQSAVYSTPRVKIAFPATYNSAWSSAYSYDVHYRLSITIESYDHTPGIVRSYVNEADSVTGWGHLTVKDVMGTPSANWNVLQVRSRTITTDSFFLNGSPMSGTVLTFLMLQQGKQDTVYEENYYRLGEVTPLAQLQYKDAQFTQPYKCTTHVQRLQNTGVNELQNGQSICLYPNPVTGTSFFINIPAHSDLWSYELLSADGRYISQSKLPPGAVTTTKITLPANTMPGTYFLKLMDGDKQVYIKQVIVR